jgi:tetratricopeptide (TPR) repeat protein
VKLLVTLAIVLAAVPARAQPAARAAFSAGRAAYSAGDYTTAIAAFEEAFRVDPRPEVAFSLAQAHRNQYYDDHDVTHLHRALGLYIHYLTEAPTGPRVTHARMHKETIETILASMPTAAANPIPVAPPTQLLVTAEAPGARASIDGDPAAPVPRLAEVTPGRHQVRISADGHDDSAVAALAVEQRLVVVPALLRPRAARLTVRAAGARIEVDGTSLPGTRVLAPGSHRITVTARGRRPEALAIELAAGAERELDVALVPTTQRRAARLTLFGSAALAGTAVLAGGLAWRAQREATAIPAPPDRRLGDLSSYRDAVARRDTWRGVSVGLGITAGAAALTGLALWYFDLSTAPETASSIAPAIGPESVGVAVVEPF